ncbi:hypothetical protein REPUB_Repub01dG0133100 [Reevesia pubescens]
MVFLKYVAITDSNVAEFLVIKEAFTIFVKSMWGSSFGLIIESDSANAIRWVNSPTSTPWKLKKYSALIE